MSYFRVSDRAGWMRTIEEVTPEPEAERQAVRVVCSHSKNAEEALEILEILGLTEHI